MEEKPKERKRNWWLAEMLKKREREVELWRPHGLSQGQTSRPLRQSKRRPKGQIAKFLNE